MKHFIFLLLFISAFSIQCSYSQSDPEFPKGFIMYLKLHNGMVTNFTSAPDIYVGGLQLAPQITVVEHVIRVGAIADAFYLNKKIQAAFGPSASIKLKTFNAGIFGSAANVNLLLDHLWGTNHQRLLGGGIVADLGNLLTVGLTVHRDYNLNNWWFQNELGIRISKKKKIAQPFNQ
jgi:hypothetical protein